MSAIGQVEELFQRGREIQTPERLASMFSTEQLVRVHTLTKLTKIMDSLKSSRIIGKYKGMEKLQQADEDKIDFELDRIIKQTSSDPEIEKWYDAIFLKDDWSDVINVTKQKMMMELGIKDRSLQSYLIIGGTPPAEVLLQGIMEADNELK